MDRAGLITLEQARAAGLSFAAPEPRACPHCGAALEPLGAALAADERAQISLDGGVTWTTLTVIGTSWSYADGRKLTDGTWN